MRLWTEAPWAIALCLAIIFSFSFWQISVIEKVFYCYDLKFYFDIAHARAENLGKKAGSHQSSTSQGSELIESYREIRENRNAFSIVAFELLLGGFIIMISQNYETLDMSVAYIAIVAVITWILPASLAFYLFVRLEFKLADGSFKS